LLADASDYGFSQIHHILMQHSNVPQSSPILLLASQSRGRRWLLESAGIDVVIMPTGIPEPDLADFSDLETGLSYLAELKARAAWRMGRVSDDPILKSASWILAADTTTRVEGQLLGKPLDLADAARMLDLLSGSCHDVLTGWRLLRTSDGLTVGGVDCTQITMRHWTHEEKETYLAGGEWAGRCGAYGLLEPDPFVVKIEGSPSNVVGLPMERLTQTLREFGILQ